MSWLEDGGWRTDPLTPDVHYCLEWVDAEGQVQTSGEIFDKGRGQMMAEKCARQWKTHVFTKDLEAPEEPLLQPFSIKSFVAPFRISDN